MPESVAFSDPTAHTNPDDIEKYLSFLAGATGEKEIFTYCLMDAASEGVITGCGVMHGKAPHLVELLEKVPGTTLHVCLNRTNTRGRRTEHMVSCRVLCADLDTVKTTGEIKALIEQYSPGMIVESSSGRYHLYWKIDSAIPLREWSTLQLGLAELLGGDYALQQMTHTIRVPGVMRVRDSVEVMPRIVWLPPEEEQPAELSHEGALLKFKTILEAAEKAKEKIKAQNKQIRKAVRGAKKGKPISLSVTSEMGRNNYLFAYLKEWIISAEVAPTQEEVTCEAQRVNTCDFGGNLLPGAEVVNVIRKVWAKAIATREWKEEQKEKRLEELTVQVIPELVAQNGQYVNGEVVAVTDDNQPKKDPDTYNEEGLFRRVVARHNENLLNKEEIVYAFERSEQTWQPQIQSARVIAGFVAECRKEMVSEPAFGWHLASGKKKSKTIEPEKLQRYRDTMMRSAVLNGVVNRVARGEDLRKLTDRDFDTDPKMLFLANGVLHVDSLEIRDATAKDLLLHRSKAKWGGLNVECPGWETFIAEIFAENDEPQKMQEFLQEVFGYSLTGSIDAQSIFIHVGGGSNGKSKVLETLDALLGSYCSRIAHDNVTKGKHSMVKDVERLGPQIEGRRAVIVDDLEGGATWNDTLIKNLIAPKFVSRKLYQEQIVIQNHAKFHFGCNKAPDPDIPDAALLRRLKLIPYQRRFEPSSAKEQELRDMRERELSGILAWAIKGYQRFSARGEFEWPEEVKIEQEQYKIDHFKLEPLVLEMYRPGSGDERSESSPETGYWVDINVILQEVSKVAFERGITEPITSEKVGHYLKSELKAPYRRRNIGRIKPRSYKIHRNEIKVSARNLIDELA